MKPPLPLPCNLPTATSPPSLFPYFSLSTPNHPNSNLCFTPRTLLPPFSFKPLPHLLLNRRHFSTLCSSNSSVGSNNSKSIADRTHLEQFDSENQWNLVEIRNPNVPPFVSSLASKFSLSDQAFFLLTFIACTTSVAFVSFVAAAVPTLYAMGRAANSLAKLADAAREELPSTMAAIRLSGLEISDLTLELSDLSQEISDGVNKSAQVVQAAEVGIRQIGALARQQTASMIQERASLPVISIQPVVSGAAKKTSRAVGHATRTLLNMISGGGEVNSENRKDDLVDRLET